MRLVHRRAAFGAERAEARARAQDRSPHRRRQRAGVALILAAAVWAAWAVAARADSADGPTISVTGEATVAASPDMATVTLGAVTRDADAVTAMNGTSTALADVIARLTALGVVSRDMQTASLVLIAREVYDPDRAVSRHDGFEARNTLTVRLRDLDLVGPVLADVLESGANSLQGLRFGLQDPTRLQNEARRLAVADAQARAALYAEAAGVPLGEILRIADGADQGGPQPLMTERAFVADSAVTVPVEAGEIEARAQVSIVFAIARDGPGEADSEKLPQVAE